MGSLHAVVVVSRIRPPEATTSAPETFEVPKPRARSVLLKSRDNPLDAKMPRAFLIRKEGYENCPLKKRPFTLLDEEDDHGEFSVVTSSAAV